MAFSAGQCVNVRRRIRMVCSKYLLYGRLDMQEGMVSPVEKTSTNER